jgi:hypothetical protein
MSQEETKENLNAENVETGLADAVAEEQEVERLPVESIGSYARLEELTKDEEAENTSNPTAQS